MDDEECLLLTDHEGSLELQSLRRVADNAQKQYLRSRPGPSPESIKRVKEMDLSQLGIHPLFSACLRVLWEGILLPCGRADLFVLPRCSL